MQLQYKPTRWTCLATAFAMALDIPVKRFFQLAGHDGSEIIFPGLDPNCRRGFHHDEAVRVALTLGYSATPIQLFPRIQFKHGPQPHVVVYGSEHNNWCWFESFIRHRRGVIEAAAPLSNHAVAFDHGDIFDPDGEQYPYSRQACTQRGLITHQLWIIEKAAQ